MNTDNPNTATHEAVLQPAYVNSVRIAHSVFDFQLLMENKITDPSNKELSIPIRVVQMSPQHFKAFAEVVKRNLKRYEEAFGEITLVEPVGAAGGSPGQVETQAPPKDDQD